MALQMNLVQMNLVQMNLAQVDLAQMDLMQPQWLQSVCVLMLLWIGFTLLMAMEKQLTNCNENGYASIFYAHGAHLGKMLEISNNYTFFNGDFDEDSDMKIIPNGYVSCPVSDPTEDEIDLYFRHKHNGNIQLAKLIGEKLADQVASYHLDWSSGQLFSEEIHLTKYEQLIFDEQARMLYIYIGEKSARDWAPDSILSQMIIASLGDGVEQHFPGFYRRMEECRAYTMYKLCGARRSGVERAMGEAFAHMIGHKEDEVYISVVSQIYGAMEESCRKLFAASDFEPHK